MTRLVCSTSQVSVGCTFLDWSINYLSGKTTFLHRYFGPLPLVELPLRNVNAHNHRKNHPCGIKETKDYVKFLQSSKEDLVTLYPFAPKVTDVASQQKINLENISADDWKFLNALVINEYNETLHWLSQQSVDIIFISLPETLSLYLLEPRALGRLFLTNKPGTADELKKNLELAFFQNSASAWKNLNLTNRWDIRERMALSQRPFEYRQWPINFDFRHQWIDAQEIWYNGLESIPAIIKQLNINIDQSRIPQWNSVFLQWQRIQLKHLQFQFEYKHIVDSIINNWHYPINLTFDQEVVIQHCLIYQHNLNLKTWELEKFPSNTKDLYKLLEPNIHPVEKIYQ